MPTFSVDDGMLEGVHNLLLIRSPPVPVVEPCSSSQECQNLLPCVHPSSPLPVVSDSPLSLAEPIDAVQPAQAPSVPIVQSLRVEEVYNPPHIMETLAPVSLPLTKRSNQRRQYTKDKPEKWYLDPTSSIFTHPTGLEARKRKFILDYARQLAITAPGTSFTIAQCLQDHKMLPSNPGGRKRAVLAYSVCFSQDRLKTHIPSSLETRRPCLYRFLLGNKAHFMYLS